MIMFKTVNRLREIAERVDLLKISRTNRMTLVMDIEAANATCPIDGEKLFLFSDFDFAHDICGIQTNINRETGELENCFLPRCAKHSK